MPSTKPDKRLLLIGWDAADWKIMGPLMDAGKMPNMKRLVEGGVMGNLATLEPPLSPMLWTSIATGMRPFNHGIHGFTEPDPGGGGIRPISSLSRKVRAIWNMLELHGKKCNVVGWWPSHPAEPIDGVMVSNLYQQHLGDLDRPWPMRPGTVHPPHLAEPMAELRVHPQELEGDMLRLFVPNADQIDQEKDQRLYSIAKVLAETASIQAAATAIMQLEPWDFMAVYFDGIDHFGHGFMKYHPPRQPWVSEEDFELYKGVVEGGYLFHDAMLGAMMALAGEDTAIMLVSDHGFHPDRLRPHVLPNEPAGPAEEHRHFGVIAANGPGFKQDELVFGASLVDVTPSILHWFGLPVGRDMDGRTLLGLFDDPGQVVYIDSWEAVEGQDGSHPPGARLDPVDTQASMEQLVELGYIERPDENKAVAIKNTVRELRYNLARSYLDAGRHADALPIFEELWDEWPDESRFGVRCFSCELTMGLLSEAEQTLAKIETSKAHYAKQAQAELKEKMDGLEKAQREIDDLSEGERYELRRLRFRAGTNQQALCFMRGRLLQAQRQYAQALEQYTLAEQTETHNLPGVFVQQGECHLALRHWAKAEAAFTQALELDPQNVAAHFGLSRSHHPRRRYQSMLDSALACIGLRFHNPQAHFLAGLALHRLRRDDEALQALTTAVAQNPIHPRAHELLAQIYGARGEAGLSAQHAEMGRESRLRIRSASLEGRPRSADKAKLLSGEWADELMERLERRKNRGPAVPLEESVVIVSGLPRSGTSMMMQMLAAGGLPILQDERRAADPDNPKGYYELDVVKRLREGESGWLVEAMGKVVKVVAPLLPNLAPQMAYRIVLMDRPLNEVIASQRAMLERQGRPVADEQTLARSYRQQMLHVEELLARHEQIRVLRVRHREAMEDPVKVAVQVSAFLDLDLDIEAMASVVDSRLYRQRGEQLE